MAAGQPRQNAVRRIALLASLTALIGCTTLSDVNPVGRDTYVVGYESMSGFESWIEVKQTTLKRANAYCAQQGKRMVALHTETSGARGWTPMDAELTFRCEAPNP